MYPNIAPKIRAERTISNPFQPEEVYGFTGRNRMIGREAVVMKQPAVIGEKIAVPTPTSDKILEGGAELVVLLGGRVLAMNPEDFCSEQNLRSFEEGEQVETMNTVDRNSDAFQHFSHNKVEVSR